MNLQGTLIELYEEKEHSGTNSSYKNNFTIFLAFHRDFPDDSWLHNKNLILIVPSSKQHGQRR